MSATDTHDAPREASTATPRMRPARPRGGWFGQLLLRLHFFAGVLVGPFVLVAALSGAFYALAPSIESVVYENELTAPATGDPLPLAQQIEAARGVVGPEAAITAVRPAPEPGATTRVMFAHEGLGPSESRGIFVDPVSAEIRGDLTVYGSSGALPLRTWASNLHRNLGLGDPGRFYSELAASWLGVVVLAGAALWLLRIRRARAKRDLLRPNLRAKGYRRVFSWHASLGVWVLIGALFLSATGITWSAFAGANVAELRDALDWGTPSVSRSLDGADAPVDEHAAHHGGASAPTGAANPATFDAVLAIAQRAGVDASEVEIQPPLEPGTAWMVREIRAAFPTEADAIAIDGTTMQVVDRVAFADFSLPAKLARWGIDLHMGLMFGIVNQIVLFVVAIGIAAMVVLGYAMWWRRRPARGGALLGTAPRRGALGSAPWWGIAAVVVVALLIGWFLPFVGYTLVAFVAIDMGLGWVWARRALRSRAE